MGINGLKWVLPMVEIKNITITPEIGTDFSLLRVP